MTIGIGAKFENGVLISADTKIVASDHSTKSDTKISLSIGPSISRLFAIATAAEDADAAKMLSSEIVDAAMHAKNPYDVAPEVKKVMAPWYRSYGHSEVPALQFIIAGVVVGESNGGPIYLCRPPNTVIPSFGPLSIGRGSRAVDPVISLLAPKPHEKLDMRSALLRLAYLMYTAKKDEGAACGGNTHTIVILDTGSFTFIENEEMKKAEELAEDIDVLLTDSLRQITTVAPTVNKESSDISSRFEDVAKKCKTLEFPSLDLLEQNIWGKKSIPEKT